MALFLEAVNVTGVVQRTPVNSTRVRITAQQGFTYRLIDDQGASFDKNVSIRRDRNSLIVDGLPAEQVVELDGFFFNCVPSTPCTFVTENLGGAQNITPASEPVGALQDGTFMMFTKGQLASVVPVAPEAEFIPKNVLVGLGAVALLGVAAGGGGGGKSGGSSANDTTPPEAPLLTSPRSSKDARPVLTGTAEAGSIVVVSLDIDGNGVSDVTYETQTDATGNWAIDLATATPSALSLPAGGIPDGANVRILLRARDQANNTSAQATTEFLTIDRTPPAQTATITSFVDDQLAQTGTIAAGGASNDLSPTLNGSISAALAAGDRIQILRNGVVVGDATINGTLWSFTDTVAPGTALAANYTVRAADALGNGGTPSAPYLVNLDTLLPAAPTVAAVSTDNIINFTEIGIPVVLSGTAEAGSTLNLTWGLRSFSTVTDGAGQWQLTVPANELPGNGSQTVSAIAVDAAGNSSIAGTRVVSVITGLPSSPVTNAVAGDNRISATEAGTNVTVSGLADPGNTVTLTWAGIPGTRTATAASNGSWTINFTVAEIALLAQGTSSLVASATDIAGNVRTAPAVSVDKDTIAPGQTLTIDSVTDNQAPLLASVGNGGITNDQTPTVIGSLGAGLASGETIHVFRNGVDVGNAAASGLSWNFTDTLTSNGTFTYTARIIDAAGNLGTNVSAAFGIVLDTVAPTQTATITNLTDDVPSAASIASGGSGNDPTPTLSGTLTGALGSGESVRIFRNGADVGSATVVGLGWTFSDSGLASGSSYTYVARVHDAAGNQSADSAGYVYLFDNVTPAPTINAVATNNIVNLAEATAGVTISGSVESGASVAVTWGATTLTTTASGGSYSITFSAAQVPATGPSTVSVVATDAAGNANAAVTQAVTIDRTLPALPTIGLVAGDDIVSTVEAAAGVSITGAAETGSTVSVVWGSTTLSQVASAGTYSITFAAGQIPAIGATTVIVTTQDAAGNTSASASRPVTVSPAAKTAAVTGITDDVAPVTGAVTSGATSNDSAPALAGTLSAALGVGETLHIYRNGVDVSASGITPAGTSWSFTDSSGGMVTGTTYTYTARVLDSALVAGPVGASHAMIFDNAAPGLPTISTVAGDNIVTASEAAAGVVIAGSAETGSTVSVVWGATTLTQIAAASAYSITFAAGQIPASGVTTVNVTATDPAGNASALASRSVTVSTVTRTASVTGITDDIPPLTGAVASGATSNDAVPLLAGTISSALGLGETLHLYRNGVDISGAGIAPSGTTWAFADSSGGMVSGTTYTYTALVLDSASVAGPAGGSHAMIFDNISPVPVIPVVAGNDIVDFAERTAGVAVSGTAEAGSSVAVTWGATTLTGTATGGTYSVTFASGQIPADGPTSVTAIATDLAGNVSASASRSLTIATSSSFTGTAGADTFLVTSTIVGNLGNSVSVLNGAAGIDTFTFSGSDALNLNLTTIGNGQVTSFERVDLTGSANNTLTLNASDVLAMGAVDAFTGGSWGGLVGSGQTQLVIDGNAGDVLNASSGWLSVGPVSNGGVTYLVFNATSGAAAVQLLVDTAITRNIT